MRVTFDGVIIGAGPNGLALGAYMARAGLRVLVLDRRYEIGGGLATEEVTLPGFYHDTHAIYHMMVEYAPPLKDLELGTRYDLKWIYPEVQVVMPFADGEYLALYRDPERSYESIKRFSQRDAETFREFAELSQKAMDIFLAPASYVNPSPSFEQLAKLEAHPIMKRMEEICPTGKSPKEIVEDLFENDRVRALFLYLATMWGLDHDLEGLGYLVPLMINRGWHFRLCHKGSHHLAHLLGRVIVENGGMIWAGLPIKRIVLKDGEASGVELEDGTVVEATKFVACSLNPHQTFFELIDRDTTRQISPELVTRVEEWRYSDWSFFTVHLALREPPHFKVAEKAPELDRALIYVVGYEGEEDLIRHFEATKRGELYDGGFNCCFPTLFDPIRAPQGYHIGLISMECAPYNLKEGGPEAWYSVREEYAQRCLSTLQRYVSNLKADVILGRYISTPLDTENKFLNMRQGCFKSGAYLPLQMGYFRPNELCSRHDTPIKKLYLCGSSSHSGGMITFGPAFCAIEKIAEDLGIDKWWPEPECVRVARQEGLLD